MKRGKCRSILVCICAGLALVGCADNQALEETASSVSEANETSGPEESSEIQESEKESLAEIDESIVEETIVEPTAVVSENLESHYDTRFLVKNGNGYIYRLSDPDILLKYDELYAEAFADFIATYRETISWQNQSFDNVESLPATNLLLLENDSHAIVQTGSYYEQDYEFDLNNVGYTYVDLDSDGTYELIFGVLKNGNVKYAPEDSIERAYAIVNQKIIKICEGGNRSLIWLGKDGCIYNYGSGGAAYDGLTRVHYDPSRILNTDNLEFGTEGFVKDEFVGIWGEYVHVQGTITDLEEEANKLENRISEDEWRKLSTEWNEQKVEIDWMRMSDYIERHPFLTL